MGYTDGSFIPTNNRYAATLSSMGEVSAVKGRERKRGGKTYTVDLNIEPVEPILRGCWPLTQDKWGVPWALLNEGDDEHDVVLMLWQGHPLAIHLDGDPLSSEPETEALRLVLVVVQDVVSRRQDKYRVVTDRRALTI